MAKLWVFLVLMSCMTVYCQELAINTGSGSVAWCRKNEKNEWRHILNEMFSGTSVKITEADCDDIGDGHLGLLITYSDGVKEIFTRKTHQNIHNFIATALRKMSKKFITSITDQSQWDSLPKTVEYIVLYTHYRDSLEHVLFQQATLSGKIPQDSILVTVHDVELLPTSMQEQATSSFHIWLVEGKNWSPLHLNTYHLAPEQVREEFINLMARLKYSAVHTYNGADPQVLYHESGLQPLMIFHEPEQKEKVVDEIIQPLVKTFRSFYVFITMDIVEYPNLKVLYKIEDNETMPYIIIMDPRYTGGLHLDKETIAYTPERLGNYLKSLVIPEENRNASNIKFGDEGVFRFDPHTLGYLTEEQDETPMLVGFCEKDTPHCEEMYNKMSKAVKEALSEHGAKLDMLVCVTVTEDLEEVAKYPVDKFPTVLLRYLGIWEEITDNTVLNYVEIIKKFGRVIEHHDEL